MPPEVKYYPFSNFTPPQEAFLNITSHPQGPITFLTSALSVLLQGRPPRVTPCYLPTGSLWKRSLPGAVLRLQIRPNGLPLSSSSSLSDCLYFVNSFPLPRPPFTSSPPRLVIPSHKYLPNYGYSSPKELILLCWLPLSSDQGAETVSDSSFVYLLCVRELSTQWGLKQCGPERYIWPKTLDLGIRQTFLRVPATSVHSPPLNTKTFL